jgi:hypothetical protein
MIRSTVVGVLGPPAPAATPEKPPFRNPGVLIHGRLGLGGPLVTPWRLVQSWPDSELVIVYEARHDARDPGMNNAVVAATDRFAPVNRQHSAGSALPLLLLPLSGDVRFDRTRPVHSENTPAYATLWSR